MKDTIKCCIISMGVGFVLGAMVSANNKKFSSVVKQAKGVAMEKIEEAKESLNEAKEMVVEKIEEVNEKEKNKKSQQSEIKGSK